MARRLSNIPADAAANAENASVSMASTSGAQYRQGVRVWFTDECTQKKGGLASMMSSNKPKSIYVLPGKVCLVKAEATDAETERVIAIDITLTATAVKKEVTLEFPDTVETSKTRGKPIKETFQFNSEQAASAFVQAIQHEKTRNYVVSANFTPKFQNDINTVLRARISTGNAPLEELYLSCFNECSPATGIEALFTNYRSLTDFEEASPASFAKLLSAAAQDPVIYILFLCCHLEASQAMMDHFQGICNSIIDNYVQLFEELLKHIQVTVSKHEWKLKRDLLLAQFQYPTVNSGTAGLTTRAVYDWTCKFTNDYRKFSMSISTLNRLLVDEKFLCFVCLQHHADKGYVQIVQEAFCAVPQDYLFSIFDLEQNYGGVGNLNDSDNSGDVGEDEGGNPYHRPATQRTVSMNNKNVRPHFVDFLFHRNLSEKTLFLKLLNAFQCGQGYDDKFFAMFLTEAIQKDKPRVAVDVINTILFTEAGEPSVHALKFCPKIPIIIFEALLSGINDNTRSGSLKVSDDIRLLLEISLRFQYFTLKKELVYIKTLARLFKDSPDKKEAFTALLETTDFLPYAINVCNHNLSGRTEEGANLRKNDSFCSTGSGRHGGGSTGNRSFEQDDEDIEQIDISLASASMNYDEPAPTNYKKYSSPATTTAHFSTGSGGASKTAGKAESSSIDGQEQGVNSHGVRAANSFLSGAARTPVVVDKYSKWLDRSDGNLIALIYGFLTLVIRCGPIPLLKDSTVIENDTVSAFLEAQAPAFYSVLLHPSTPLRARITDFLREQFNIVSLYDQLLGDNLMLSKAAHFRYSFLHGLAYDAHFLTDYMVNLMVVAVKLEQYADLYQRLHDIDFELGRSQEKQHQLEVILHHTIERDSEELVVAGLTLQDVCSFANAAAAALIAARGNADKERVVVDQVQQLLVEQPADTWKAGFQAL